VTILFRRPAARFALAALVVLSACVLILRSRAFAADPDVRAWGVTFDLTITIPLLYWFFVVRPRRASPLTLASVFIVCTMAAALLVPRSQQFFLHDLKYLVAALEVVLIATAMRRPRLAALITSEATILYYALFTWRKAPEHVDGRAVTFHERSGWGSVVACVIVLIASEGIAAHLFLATWSVKAAWAWTFLDVWGALWLAGDYQALRLRRSFVDSEALHLRIGMRWTATIALSNIASIEAVRSESEWKRRDVLRVAMLDEPRWLVTLHEPVVAQGLAGIKKTIRAVALLPDDDRFVSDALSGGASCPAAARAALR